MALQQFTQNSSVCEKREGLLIPCLMQRTYHVTKLGFKPTTLIACVHAWGSHAAKMQNLAHAAGSFVIMQYMYNHFTYHKPPHNVP